MFSENVARYESPPRDWNAPVPQDGRLSISLPDDQGIIKIQGHGLWSLDYLNQHFRELDAIIAQARRWNPDVLALVDLREAPVQSPEVAESINANTRRVYRDQDRIAIVVQSSLVKLQMKRVVDCAHVQIFISVSAAYTWLTA
jgi:hypothetical protein